MFNMQEFIFSLPLTDLMNDFLLNITDTASWSEQTKLEHLLEVNTHIQALKTRMQLHV